MKPIRISILAIVALLALAFVQKTEAQTYFGTEMIVSASTTALASATAGQIIPIFNFPANAGNFVFTGGDVAVVSGTINNTAPTIAILSGTTGSTPLLSGDTQLTGTTLNTATHLAALTTNLPVVVTGSTGASVGLDVTTTGTSSTAHTDIITLKGYYYTPSGHL